MEKKKKKVVVGSQKAPLAYNEERNYEDRRLDMMFGKHSHPMTRNVGDSIPIGVIQGTGKEPCKIVSKRSPNC